MFSTLYYQPQPVHFFRRPYYNTYYQPDDNSDDDVDVIFYRPPSQRRPYRVQQSCRPRRQRKIPVYTACEQPVKPIPQQKPLYDRAAAMKRFNQAATIIQRAYRNHIELKHNEAAFKIQRVFKAYQSRKQVIPIINKLKELQAWNRNVDQLIQDATSNAIFNRPIQFRSLSTDIIHTKNHDLLAYEDALVKSMLKADAVESQGHSIIRDKRKQLIKRLQSLLDEVDSFKRFQVELRKEELQTLMDVDISDDESTPDLHDSMEQLFAE
eukprot:Partr_v1_DN29017_c0_g2_i1_m58591